jgi:hypothetical protein
MHQNVAELGALYGLSGLDPKKTTDERIRDAYIAAVTGGVIVDVPFSDDSLI